MKNTVVIIVLALAISDFDNAIGIDPGNAEAFYRRGVAKILAGDKPNGSADLEKAGSLGHPKAAGDKDRYCR